MPWTDTKSSAQFDGDYQEVDDYYALVLEKLGEIDPLTDSVREIKKIVRWTTNKLAGIERLLKSGELTQEYQDILVKFEFFVNKATQIGVDMNEETFIILGTLHEIKGEAERALDLYVEAEKHANTKKKAALAGLKCKIARACETVSKHSEAITYYKDAFDMYQEDEKLVEAARVTANLGDIHYYSMEDPEESIEHYKKAVEIFRKANVRSESYDVLISISKAYVELENEEEALECLRAATELELSDVYTADAYMKIGEIHTASRDFDGALKSFGRAIELYERNGDFLRSSLATAGIGNVFLEKGDFKKAMTTYLEVAPDIEKIKDKRTRVQLNNNMGKIYLSIGNIEKALKYLVGSLKMAEKEEFKEEISSINTNLGSIYYKRGRLDDAAKYFQAATEIDKELDDERAIGTDYTNMAMIYRDRGDLERAVRYLELALVIAEKYSDMHSASIRLGHMGRIKFQEGNYKGAIEALKRSIEMGRKAGNENHQAYRFMDIAEVLLAIKKVAKAEELVKKATRLFEHSGDTNGLSLSYHMLGNIMMAKSALELSGKSEAEDDESAFDDWY